MGFYNVVKPCVVNDLHYVRPHAEPIEVSDEDAAAVESEYPGALTPYPAQTATADALVELAEAGVVPVEEVEQHKPRTRRRSAED